MADQGINYSLNLKDYFRKTMLGAESDTKKLDGSMNKLGQTISKIGGAIIGAFALGKVWDFTKAVVLATAAAASFSNAIMASSRSEGEGVANLSFLNREVDRLGLNLEAARSGYKTFSGAVMGSNIQGQKSNRIFRQVSEAATVLGLSAEQTEGSFLALGQMISKGTVQAEELRGQLAERIPGAFQIGARAMGMTTKQLGDAMKDGLIKSEEFLVKFGDELEKTFGTKLGAATNSVQANLNRMSNEWQRLQENIGKSNTGMINGITSWTASIVRSLNEIIMQTNRMDQAFQRAGLSEFTFFQKKGSMIAEAIGLDTRVTKAQALDRSLQSMYVGPSTRGNNEAERRANALGSEAGLLRLMSGFGKSFANKEIGKDEYKRSLAMMESALLEIRGNKTLNDTSKPAPNSGDTAGKAGASGSIGSSIDVSGARPQNITINVDKLVETLNIHSETMEGGTKQAAAMTKKEFLELLNDANLIANR